LWSVVTASAVSVVVVNRRAASELAIKVATTDVANCSTDKPADQGSAKCFVILIADDSAKNGSCYCSTTRAKLLKVLCIYGRWSREQRKCKSNDSVFEITHENSSINSVFNYQDVIYSSANSRPKLEARKKQGSRSDIGKSDPNWCTQFDPICNPFDTLGLLSLAASNDYRGLNVKTSPWKLLICFLAALVAGNTTLLAQEPDEVKASFVKLKQSVHSADDWQAWQHFIMPTESDLKWKKTAWLSTFKEGIAKAANEDKPVLLWTMNGHPLGCT
jgi:hypothetical protein